jgi:hypothetical protein
MAPGQKKVVLRTKSGSVVWGYLPSNGFVENFTVSMMEVNGRVTPFLMNEIRTIAYVRDFNLEDSVDPERMGRSTFAARPRGDGLWLRLTFLDGEILEGLTSFHSGFVDSLIEDQAIVLTPPDARGNTQRVFVPRSALSSVEVLGFVTAPSKRVARAPAGSDRQATLFGGELAE